MTAIIAIINFIGPLMVWMIATIGPWVMGLAGIILLIIWLRMIPGLWRDLAPRQKPDRSPDGMPVRFWRE